MPFRRFAMAVVLILVVSGVGLACGGAGTATPEAVGEESTRAPYSKPDFRTMHGHLVIVNHGGTEEYDLAGTGYIILVEEDDFRREDPQWGGSWGAPDHPGGRIVGVGITYSSRLDGPRVPFSISYNAAEIDPELDYFIEVHYGWQEITQEFIDEDGNVYGHFSKGNSYSNAPGSLDRGSVMPTPVLTKGHPEQDVEVEIAVLMWHGIF